MINYFINGLCSKVLCSDSFFLPRGHLTVN